MSNIFELPILYKIDNNSSIRYWKVWTIRDQVYTEYGTLNGVPQTSVNYGRVVNKGTSAELSAEEHAKKIAKSKWNDKKVTYTESLESLKEITNWGNQTPMLAKVATRKRLENLEFPIMMQPKLDGVRMMAFIKSTNPIKTLSRSGRRIVVPYRSRLASEINELYTNRHLVNLVNNCMLDGELYVHGMHFSGIQSALATPEYTEYHVYDIVSRDNRNQPSQERQLKLQKLKEALDAIKGRFEKIKIVPTVAIANLDEVRTQHNAFVHRGYEGSIIRAMDAPYSFDSRVDAMLKVKDRHDSEFIISDIIEGKGKMAGRAIFICKNDIDDNTFQCVLAPGYPGALEVRKKIYEQKRKYINKVVTVEYFGRTSHNLPREPVAIKFKDEKLN